MCSFRILQFSLPLNLQLSVCKLMWLPRKTSLAIRSLVGEHLAHTSSAHMLGLCSRLFDWFVYNRSLLVRYFLTYCRIKGHLQTTASFFHDSSVGKEFDSHSLLDVIRLVCLQANSVRRRQYAQSRRPTIVPLIVTVRRGRL